jgi:hypothetical protein
VESRSCGSALSPEILTGLKAARTSAVITQLSRVPATHGFGRSLCDRIGIMLNIRLGMLTTTLVARDLEEADVWSAPIPHDGILER